MVPLPEPGAPAGASIHKSNWLQNKHSNTVQSKAVLSLNFKASPDRDPHLPDYSRGQIFINIFNSKSNLIFGFIFKCLYKADNVFWAAREVRVPGAAPAPDTNIFHFEKVNYSHKSFFRSFLFLKIEHKSKIQEQRFSRISNSPVLGSDRRKNWLRRHHKTGGSVSATLQF